MKYLIILFFCCTKLNAQNLWFCGTTKYEVKTILTENKKEFTIDKLTDSTSRVSWLIKNAFQMIWAFNSKDSLFSQTLISEHKNGINEFVQMFNKDFVIISSTKWRNYNAGVIYEIELIDFFGEFIFTIKPVKI